MSFDPAHAATLVELARVERHRAALRAAADHLLACLAEDHLLWISLSLTVHDAIDLVCECGVRHPEDAQDPIADAEEDEAYRAAVAAAVERMDAAEQREDAADALAALAKGRP